MLFIRWPVWQRTSLPMSTKDGNIIILSDGMGGIEVPFDNLVQAVIVLSIGVLIIICNVIIIATFITAPGN